MVIEVVNPGESLYAISRRYGVPVDDIVRVNGLSDPNRLVVGQALLIPTRERRHTVRPGESLWAIAHRYNVTVEELARLNNITNPAAITAGMVLRIPEAPRRTIEVNAYLEPSTPERDRQKVAEAAPALTYLSIFQYRVRPNGDLAPPNEAAALAAVRTTDVVPMMVITNFDGGTFSPEIAHAIFMDAAARERLIDNVVRIMGQREYYALNIDFENLRPEDRERYNAFLSEITPRVRAAGHPVSTALAPKTSERQTGAWYEAHDYPAHGRIVDFVIIMTYEWGWSGGPPMPVAPLPQVRQVLNYAVSVIPRGKIMMGAPLYGYDWTLPYVHGGPFARTLGLNEAVERAAAENAAILYDPTAQAPHYEYTDDQRRRHTVWFEDVRSMQAKFDLLRDYGLRGISYWALGRPAPQVWALLLYNFNVRKYR